MLLDGSLTFVKTIRSDVHVYSMFEITTTMLNSINVEWSLA